MSRRPHSREERISSGVGSVQKHDFSGQNRGFSSGTQRSGLGSSLGLLGLLSLFGKNKKGSLVGTIVKLVIIIFVISLILRFFTLSSDNDNYTYNDNNYASNYNQNTSSSNLNYDVNKNAREKFTTLIGDGKDEVTVMVYMIGTDLESSYGCATSDLYEMDYAEIKDNINIVIETGGASRWNNNIISSKTIQRFTLNSSGLLCLQDNVGNKAMTEPGTLSDFIKYASSNFKANRYILILWDHGGGSVTGYGYDEKFPNVASLAPNDIAQALKDGGVKFDLVGFDACLMANLETAIAIEPYADYMIASEETEPGDGWYYTNWIKALDENPSISTLDLGKKIIDDYVDTSKKADYTAEITESLIDLGDLVASVKEPLTKFSKATANKLNSDDYQSVANARGVTKEFSKSSNLDQIDLVDLALNFDVDGSDELVEAIKSSVKYNKTYNIYNAYGLSAYFPYTSLSKMNDMVEIYDDIDIDEDYTNVVKSFASFASSGQIVTNSSNNSATSIFDILMSDNYYTSSSNYSYDDIYSILNGGYGSNSYTNIFGSGYDSWFDSSMMDLVTGYFARGNIVDTNELNIIDKNGTKVVSMSDEQWELIDTVNINMFVDDGGGYIDLGKDNLFKWDNDGDLIVESDGTWLTLNDHFVSYYMVSDEYVDDNNYKTVGKIPAYLNNQKVDIMVSFTPTYPYGHIDGANVIYENSDTQQKGLIEIKDGDVIKFICNYYSYNGELINEYQLGDNLVVNGELELYNKALSNKAVYTYCFKDIYGNNLYTPRSEIN